MLCMAREIKNIGKQLDEPKSVTYKFHSEVHDIVNRTEQYVSVLYMLNSFRSLKTACSVHGKTLKTQRIK